MDTVTIADLGRALYDAERDRRTLRPLSEDHPGGSVEHAYAVQEEYARLRLASGTRLVGRKIGCTSRAIQELFGIDTPDFGQIFEDMVVPDGGAIPVDDLIAPMVEPEIAFLLSEDLAGPGVGVDDVVAATRAVAPCLEIIDSRVEDWEIAFFDTVADNGSSARCVIGEPRPVSSVDLVAEAVTLHLDGSPIATATGEAVLGNPAASVAWLANALAPLGRSLRAGEFVLSGSMTTAARIARGQRYEAHFSTIGRVSCEFV